MLRHYNAVEMDGLAFYSGEARVLEYSHSALSRFSTFCLVDAHGGESLSMGKINLHYLKCTLNKSIKR